MYSKCGSLVEARKVFDTMRERNLFTWSAMIGGCIREKKWEDVVELFYMMKLDGCCIPDGFLVHRTLQACANCGDLVTGRLLHSIAIRFGFMDSSAADHVSNSILAMYVKCNEIQCAKTFFDKLGTKKDLVTWNTMLSGYCQFGRTEVALQLFDTMQKQGIKLGIITWNILISGLNQSDHPEKAMEMMKKMKGYGILPDVFTWTSLISGLAHNNRTVQALEFFHDMKLANVEPNGMTLMVALSACASLKNQEKGKELHCLVVKMGHSETIPVCNSLIDMYSKCGKIEIAESIFNKLPNRDVLTWNSMIGGYIQSGYSGKAYDLFSKMKDSDVCRNAVTWNVLISGYMQSGDDYQAIDLFQRMEKEGVSRNTSSWNLLISGSLHNRHGSSNGCDRNKALGIFRQMQALNIKPNSVTILSVLPACANLTSFQKIKEIHACVLRHGLHSKISVLNSLIDSYAKSGDIGAAESIFRGMSRRDTITWGSLISGYVLHRRPKLALDVFSRMKSEEVKPNKAALAGVLFCYGLLKMVDDGKQLFSTMMKNHQIKPGLEHYSAMVELLGRSGRVEEASEFIDLMEIESNFTVWFSLFTACRIHGCRKKAVTAVENMIRLEPWNPINRWLLLQLQSSTSSKLIKLHKQVNEEEHGCCWIEHSRKLIEFSTGESWKLNSIYNNKLDAFLSTIKQNEAIQVESDSIEIEEEEKEAITGTHSEKIAMGFKLISSSNTSHFPAMKYKTLRIIKNLRMCLNCHTATKLISASYECEILLKDPVCLHRFKDGACSCEDYW